jgi:hypothetical protein
MKKRRKVDAEWWRRWVESRQMIIGLVLSAASYAPAIMVGGEWIGVFGGISLATVGLGQIKNMHDNHVAAQATDFEKGEAL